MHLRNLTAAVVAGITSLLPAIAHAQDNSAVIESLFAEGKSLAEKGELGLACPKFLASYALEKRIGTLLNLADCYERNGQLASALARYAEAAPLTERARQKERLAFAVEHATALEPRVARLTLVVVASAPGLEIKRDGVLVEPASYGVGVPVDVGSHVVTASAPGARTWTSQAVIRKDGERASLTIPALASASVPASSVDTVTPPRAEDTTSETPSSKSTGTSTRKVVGVLLSSMGVVSLGIGTGFGLAALGKDSDSSPYCGQNGAGKNDCVGDGIGYRSDAVSSGNVSTVFFAAGTALVVSGVVLWLTAPSSRPAVAARLRSGVVF
jgi:hypothetical protein